MTDKKQFNIKSYKFLKENQYKVIDYGVYSNSLKFHDFKPSKHFGFVAVDDQDQLIGGLYGATYYKGMKIDQLWVDEDYRGEGVGSALVKQAELLAEKEKVDVIALETMSWEAPEFYKKLGYIEKGRIEGYVNGGERYIFSKKLTHSS